LLAQRKATKRKGSPERATSSFVPRPTGRSTNSPGAGKRASGSNTVSLNYSRWGGGTRRALRGLKNLTTVTLLHVYVDKSPTKLQEWCVMKWFLTISGVLVLIAGMVSGFFGHPGVIFIALFGFIGLLIAANLDRISEFKASKSGIEAKTREVIARAESTLSELQLLARNVGELTLSLVKRSGRWGGYDDDEEEKIKTSVLELLKKVGVPEAEFPKLLSEWDRFTEFDYAHAILGGSTIPDGADEALVAEWKNLHERNILQIPTPDDIRKFLTKNNFMTDELNEYLKDYEYYRAHKAHRRPDVWRERLRWGRLKKR
jgi:hypothetical protein